MDTLITNDIKVSVETFYQPSSPQGRAEHVFAYRITIENLGEKTVQLMRRYWLIADSSGQVREVEGEGVIGKQPVLPPGETHQYTSWCPLTTGIGKMSGYYTMRSRPDNQEFEVGIPEFQLIATFLMN